MSNQFLLFIGHSQDPEYHQITINGETKFILKGTPQTSQEESILVSIKNNLKHKFKSDIDFDNTDICKSIFIITKSNSITKDILYQLCKDTLDTFSFKISNEISLYLIEVSYKIKLI